MSTAAKEVFRIAKDMLAHESRDSDLVSGCHLVAYALKNERMDTVRADARPPWREGARRRG